MLEHVALITLVIASIANLTLGYLAFNKNRRSATNRLFGVLCLALVGWAVADHLQLFSLTGAAGEWTFRLAIMLVGIQNLSYYLFLSTFPNSHIPRKLTNFLMIILGLTAAINPLTHWFGQYMDGGGIMPGQGGMFFMGTLVIFALSGIGLAIRQLRRLSGQSRNQMRYFLAAAVVLWLGVPTSDFILPSIFNIQFSYALSPLITLLFAGIIAYAVVRQRLFDVRPLVARSLAYSLFLTLLVVAYVLGAFGLSNFFTK